MSAAPPVLIDGLGSFELERSQPQIYDRPVELNLLHRDSASGAEHYLVRYPAGLRARRHRHSAAHTIVVLDGAMDGPIDVIPVEP